MTQLNTPYPATAYLTGFLRAHGGDLGLTVSQADASLALFLRLFSAPWLERMAEVLRERARAARRRAPAMPPSIAQFLAEAPRYVATVEPAVRFLQGRDPSLALRIVGRELLPEGPRFKALAEAAAAGDDPLGAAFGALGTTDQARYLASLYVDDLADVWRDGIDPKLELARYGERLAASAPTFEPLHDALESDEPTLVDETLDELTRELVALHRPDVVGITAPFPGNVYGAFRIARAIRNAAPAATLVSIVGLAIGVGLLLVARRMTGAITFALPWDIAVIVGVAVLLAVTAIRGTWRRLSPLAGAKQLDSVEFEVRGPAAAAAHHRRRIADPDRATGRRDGRRRSSSPRRRSMPICATPTPSSGSRRAPSCGAPSTSGADAGNTRTGPGTAAGERSPAPSGTGLRSTPTRRRGGRARAT